MIDTLFQFSEWIIFFILLAIGYIFGRIAEARHYASIRAREKQLAGILTFSSRWPPQTGVVYDSTLVSGSVVVSADYFKMFVGSLRNLVGGRFRGYETLLDRGRREAILRMKEEAHNRGAALIFNVKFESSQIGGRGQRGISCIELLAYGTALIESRTTTKASTAP